MPSSSSKSSKSSKSASKQGSSKSTALVQRQSSKPVSVYEDPIEKDNKIVWKAVKSRNGNGEHTVLAVVRPEQEEPMIKLIDEKSKEKKLQSNVVIATSKNLQDHIKSLRNIKVQQLHILVDTGVDCITYHISKAIKTVFVACCRPTGRPNTLRIGSVSSYCDFRTYAWPQRPAGLLNHTITHAEGIVWNISDDQEKAIEILQQHSSLQQPAMNYTMSKEQCAKVRNQCDNLERDLPPQPRGKWAGPDRPVSSGAAASTSRATNGTAPWLEKWKALLSVVIGAGAGLAGMYGVSWISVGGVYITGPYGFSIAAGYFTAGFAGGVAAVGAGTTIAAGAAVYFIPWGRIFEWIKQLLKDVWKYVCDVFVRAWEKTKELSSNFIARLDTDSCAALPKSS